MKMLRGLSWLTLVSLFWEEIETFTLDGQGINFCHTSTGLWSTSQNECYNRFDDARKLSCSKIRMEMKPSLSSERVLGVDYGTKRVGIAISAGGIAPRPVKIIQNSGDDSQVIREIKFMARAEQISSFVVGVPLQRDGAETNQSIINRNFSQTLADEVSPRVPVYVWNEAFSSVAAESLLLHKSRGEIDACLDAVAACMILEDYFSEDGWGAELIPPRSPRPQKSNDDFQLSTPAVTSAELGSDYEVWKAAAMKKAKDLSLGQDRSGKKKKKKKKKK
uniref:YqgF/RNase H-like domain-containing protein n=1 Tax=Heterosigma akashiwo TaxID=2829 RepID=A0A7S4D691_HETAK